VNPRTTRVNSSRGQNTHSSKRDRNRLRDNFQENNGSRGFSGFSIENHVSTLPTDLENEEEEEDDVVVGEEEDEVLELEDSSSVLPMPPQTRMSSFVASSSSSVMCREQTRFNHDKENLLETSGFSEQKCLQPGPVNSDPPFP
jgi:hypothetical protein